VVRTVRILVALISSVLLAAPAGAQRWFTEFRPDPRCAPIVALGKLTAGAPAPGALIVIPVDMATRERLRGAWVLVTDPIDSVFRHPLANSRVADSTSRHLLTGLPPGPALLLIRSIGYVPTRETVIVRSGAIDTLVVPVRVDLQEGIRCTAPGYRRTGEPACVTDREDAEAYIEMGRRFASTAEERLPGLGPFTTAEVELVHDERVCERAGKAYGHGKGPARRVLVVRLGAAWFIVFDPFEPDRAGEFATSYIFDNHWRVLLGIGG
jgi:hypothetical protein